MAGGGGRVNVLHSRNHRWGPTHQHLTIRTRRRQPLLDHLLADEPNTPSPSLRRVVQHIVHLQSRWLPCPGIAVQNRLDLVLEEDVLLVDVGVDEGDGGVVEGVLQGGFDDLDHGGDTGAAGDHADVRREGGVVDEVALGALDADFVVYFEEGEVAGDVAFFVCLEEDALAVVPCSESAKHGAKLDAHLDEEIKVAAVIVAGDRGVAAHDVLAVDLC